MDWPFCCAKKVVVITRWSNLMKSFIVHYHSPFAERVCSTGKQSDIITTLEGCDQLCADGLELCGGDARLGQSFT